MNLIFGIIALFLCVLIGRELSMKYTRRKEFYYEFFDFNERLISEVAFSKNTLGYLISIYKQRGDFIECINEYLKNKNLLFNKGYLTNDEKKNLFQYVETVCKGDNNLQIAYLKSINEHIETKRSNAVEEELKYKKLYIKLGFLIGLIVLVVFL